MEKDLLFVALESRTRTKCYISTFQLNRGTFLVQSWPSRRNRLPWEVVSNPLPECAETTARDHLEGKVTEDMSPQMEGGLGSSKTL